MAETPLSPESVGEYYDQWTERYFAGFGDTFQACRPTHTADLHQYILERSGIRDGERVLDAGCGICGPSLYFASHRDLLIDAVTVSEHQVTMARERVRRAGLEGKVKVYLADFHRLDDHFPAARFDRVLFLESLSHSADTLAALRSVFRVLRAGGVVYIKDFFEKQCDCDEERRRVREVIERVNRTFVLKTPVLRRTVELLREVGFVQLSMGSVEFPNDTSVWRRFNDLHAFDVYGGNPPFPWSDWCELRFMKPISAVASHASRTME